jgi:radical SAM protein with 4Fe4S-binding SPASM domain
MPDRPFGNVRQRPLLELFRDSPYWDQLWDRSDRDGHCRTCRYKNYCGGCRARADAYFGSMKASDPGCIFNQQAWDELVDRGLANPEPAEHPIRQRHAFA